MKHWAPQLIPMSSERSKGRAKIICLGRCWACSSGGDTIYSPSYLFLWVIIFYFPSKYISVPKAAQLRFLKRLVVDLKLVYFHGDEKLASVLPPSVAIYTLIKPTSFRFYF